MAAHFLLALAFAANAGSIESLKTRPLPSISPHAPIRSLGRKTVSGTVSFVPDGDTVHFESDGKTLKLRLEGIDAPERSQPFGPESGASLRSWILGKSIRVRVTTEDTYGRLVGTAYAENGKNINAAMVAAGLAWWYRYFSDDATLERLEGEARSARRGLWSQNNPEAPWDYRRRTWSPSGIEEKDPLEMYQLRSVRISRSSPALTIPSEAAISATATAASNHSVPYADSASVINASASVPVSLR